MMGKHAGDRGNNKGFRATDETWEAFLGHLAAMSAVEASKQPRMPSAPAFVKKRHRDLAFAARAEAAMAARRLENSGRKRIDAATWVSFLERLPASSVKRLVAEPGMPSAAAVYSRRRRVPSFRAALDAILYDVRRQREIRISASLRLIAKRQDAVFVESMNAALCEWRSRQPGKPAKIADRRAVGEKFHADLLRNDIYAAASSVVSAQIDRAARMDIISDLVLAVLEREIAISDLQSAAKEYAKRYWKMFGSIGAISLDAPLRSDSTMTIGDCLSGDAQSYWEAA